MMLFPIKSFVNVNNTLSQMDAAIDAFEKRALTMNEEFALEDAIESCIQMKQRLEKILLEHNPPKEKPSSLWQCLECDYEAKKGFSSCPKCGSEEIWQKEVQD